MSGLPYFNKYAEDWLNGVRRLTLEQRGAYETLLCLMYASGGEIDDDDAWLARECNASPRTYRRIKAELIELGKIWVIDGKIGNGRASDELAKQQQVRAKHVANGRKGAATRWKGDAPPVEEPAPEPAKSKSLARSSARSSAQTPAVHPPIIEPKSDEKHSKNSESTMARPSSGRWQPELRTQKQIETSSETPEPRAGGPASPVTGAGPPGPRRTKPPDNRTPEQRAADRAAARAAAEEAFTLTRKPGDPIQ